MQNYVVDSGKLKEYTTKLFLAAGLAQTDAQAVSELLVHADLRNVRSHGVLRTVPYLEKIQKGGASKTSAYPVVKETTNSAVIDAQGGLGALSGREGGGHCPRKGENGFDEYGGGSKQQPFRYGSALGSETGRK